MIEVLSNFLRSVIVLSPNDLVACVYLSLNQLAPAYEGLELGIAETTLMKVIGQTTGRSMAQIKTDAQSTGDLGIVAERSKSNQRMMFTPAPLTVEGVFVKVKEIAKMSGHAVSWFFTRTFENIEIDRLAFRSFDIFRRWARSRTKSSRSSWPAATLRLGSSCDRCWANFASVWRSSLCCKHWHKRALIRHQISMPMAIHSRQKSSTQSQAKRESMKLRWLSKPRTGKW